MKDIFFVAIMIVIIALVVGGLFMLFKEAEKSHTKADQKQQAEFYECLEMTDNKIDYCYELIINK